MVLSHLFNHKGLIWGFSRSNFSDFAG